MSPGYSKAVGAVGQVGCSCTAVEEVPVEGSHRMPEVVADSSSRDVAAAVAAEAEHNLQDSCSMTCSGDEARNYMYMSR